MRPLLRLISLTGAVVAALAPRAQAASDNMLGMALMGAYVAPDGAIIFGSGATGGSRSSAGRYVVTFDRNVRDCIVAMTPYDPNRFPYGGQIGVSAPNSIEVMVQNGSGAEADSYFYLLLFCNK